MTDAPKRIFAWLSYGEETQGQFYEADGQAAEGDIEYVRADLVEAIMAKIEKCGCPCCGNTVKELRDAIAPR